jgi:hypothetical protein
MKVLVRLNLFTQSLLVVPIALTAIAASSQSAQAGALTGSFHLDGGYTVGGNPDSSIVTLSKNQLIFTPDPTPVALSLQTGDFAPFNSASIKDILSFGTTFVAENPFLDFGYIDIPGTLGLGLPGEGSITDGVETFTLSKAKYELKQSGANVAIDVALWGDFLIGGVSSKGAGNLSFQTNNTTVAAVQSLLDNGGSLDASFSGALFTAADVPESSPVLSLLGLGVVGAGAVLRKRL